jgi:hypothetical protein
MRELADRDADQADVGRCRHPQPGQRVAVDADGE